MRALVGVTVLGLVAAPAHSTDRGAECMSSALRGDLRPAKALLLDVPEAQLSPRERELAAAFRRRFVDRKEEPALPGISPLAGRVVTAYRNYWTRSLLGEAQSAAAETTLAQDLRTAWRDVGETPPGAGDDLLERTRVRLERDGLHALAGRTQPYLELMLWAREDTTRYDVELTDGMQRVEVVFMRDFLVKGWADWATLGHASTGGWAMPQRLFCLGDDYDPRSEKFRVSYLQHEGRHFADYAKFPKLRQVDLEYRAKLTELAYADTTWKTLVQNFAATGALDTSAPHSYANRCVVRDVAQEIFGTDVPEAKDPRWDTVDPSRVHAAARMLLERHTARLVAAGADSVQTVLVPAGE
ncbi:MAG: hypothetical protein U0167_14420 [bacterium]